MNWIIGILAFLGLYINLLYNFLANEELLKDKYYLKLYILAYISTAFVLTAASLYLEWASSVLVFNWIVGLTLPQIALYYITKNKYKNYETWADSKLKENQRIIEDLNRSQNELKKSIATSLALSDSFFVEMLFSGGCNKNEIEQIFRDRRDDHVLHGLLTKEVKQIYDDSIKIIIASKFMFKDYELIGRFVSIPKNL
jgi:hypothetical protein